MNRRLSQFAVLPLLLLGVFPQILLTAETFGCGMSPELPLWILAICLFIWAASAFHSGILIGMPLSALTLFLAFRRFDADPVLELNDLSDKVAGAFYTQFAGSGSGYSYLDAAEDHSFVLLLLAFLLAAYLASALTSQRGRAVMCILGTLPVFAGCLAFNGEPSYPAAVAMLLFWALMLLSGGSYHAERADGKNVFLAFLPLSLLLCALLWFNKPWDYSYDERDVSLSKRFDAIGEAISRWLDKNVPEEYQSTSETLIVPLESDVPSGEGLIWQSIEGGMDLTQRFDPEMLEKLFFRVKTDFSGNLYLRAVSYGDYTGTAWESAGAAPVASLAFSAQAFQGAGTRQRLEFRRVTALRYACLPYYSLLSGESDAFVYASDSSREIYDYIAYTGDYASLSQARTEEKEYRDYAHRYYTRLPEGTRQAVLALAARAGLAADTEDLPLRIAEYIRNAAEYDLYTESYASDDYAVCFLTEARRGYCVHFATAATVMFRALGVPARITEGFLVPVQSGKLTEVYGANAHAWVEIYQDGIGWIPIEVTGQSGLSEPQEDAQTEMAFPQQTQAAASPTPEPTPSPLPVGVIRQEEISADIPAPSALPAQTAVKTVLWLVLLLCVLPLWRLLCRLILNCRIGQKDPNRAAIAVWRCSERAARFGVVFPPEILNCAEKAFFSAQGVSREESLSCRALLQSTLREAYPGLPLFKRFCLKYLWGLI